MWGYEVALRVRDRKIGEIAKVMGYTNVERRYKLLGELGRDLEICNCTVSGAGVCMIPSVPISDPGYRSALSGTDLDDELDLDSIRAAPPQIRDFIRDMFNDAARYASEDRSGPYKDAVDSMKEELSICRERIDELSAQIDYKRSELEASEEDKASLQETIDRQAAEISALKSRISDMTDEAGVAHARMEELSAQIDELKSLRSEEPEPSPIVEQESLPEEPEPAPAEEPDDGTDLLGRIKAMKMSKIDLFMDRMMAGEMDMDDCDDLISILKVDIAFLDAMASDRDLSKVPFASQPSSELTKTYRETLSEEEHALEVRFKEIFDKAYSDQRGCRYGGIRGAGRVHRRRQRSSGRVAVRGYRPQYDPRPLRARPYRHGPGRVGVHRSLPVVRGHPGRD